jgi:hypothetical protein
MFCEKVREWQGDESEVIRATCVESCAIHPSKGIGSYRRLRKEQTDPPTYYLAIGGEDTRLTANELWRHSELCRAVMTQIDRVVPPMKDARWRDILQQLLDDIQVLQVPAEMTPRGELWSAMCDWFSGSSEHEEDIEAKPVQRDEHIYFKLRGLGAFLRRQGLNPKRDVMWAVLKDRGGCNGTSRFAGVVHRVWWLPAVEFSEQTLQDEPFLDSRNALTRNARKISENDF